MFKNFVELTLIYVIVFEGSLEPTAPGFIHTSPVFPSGLLLTSSNPHDTVRRTELHKKIFLMIAFSITFRPQRNELTAKVLNSFVTHSGLLSHFSFSLNFCLFFNGHKGQKVPILTRTCRHKLLRCHRETS